jgi:acyl dehydratase
MQIGQSVSAKRILSQQDFDRFAALSGDDNPIHVDPEFAARTRFGRTVAHGMLLYSTVCGVLGAQLPGPGALQVEQELMFPSATCVGEEVTIRLEVTQLDAGAGLADMSTIITKLDGSVGLQGRTLVSLPGAASTHPSTIQRVRLKFVGRLALAGKSPLKRDLQSFLSTNFSQTPIQPTKQPTFKNLAIGQRAETRRTFTTQDLAEYADLSGDANPLFTDAGYARRMGFAGAIIPGGLLGGLFSCLLGTRLPGRGTNYLKQRLGFPAPAYPDQELTAAVEIVRLRPDKQLVNLSAICYNPDSEIVCQGEALVLVSDVEGNDG